MGTKSDKITVTKAKLNTPPFSHQSVTISLVITNLGTKPLCGFTFTDCTDTYGLSEDYIFDKDSAVLFFEEKKHSLTAMTTENKITLKGIFVPPRESVFVFYRLHKLTD